MKKNNNLFRHLLVLVIVFVFVGILGSSLAPGALAGPPSARSNPGFGPSSNAYVTTVAYVTEFYPLWFTHYQARIGSVNRLIGPIRVSPIYQSVVAINNDTLYASTFVDLAVQPLILTIPATQATYSILTLDPYGDLVPVGIPRAEGVYGITGPGYGGTLPPGVIPVSSQLDHFTLIFRIDRYSAAGEKQVGAAKVFRRNIKAQLLCDYLSAPCPIGAKQSPKGDTTLILPELAFATPFKVIADKLTAIDRIGFLKQLQVAVAGPNTPPMSAYQQLLSNRFNELFGDGEFEPKQDDLRLVKQFTRGVKKARELIMHTYLDHLGPTNWIHFDNIGQWGDEVIERASISEFIQYGNGPATAAYYHTFRDSNNQPLNGSGTVYILTFPANDLPQANRFWSVTAYTPKAIELIQNSTKKYLVASYTPGLQSNNDGSISIYMSVNLPQGVPEANWLPVRNGPFNIMLRLYGPLQPAGGDYVPPFVMKQ